jgi:hypothetical protein
MVESQPSKLLVAGPIPVSRSIFSTTCKNFNFTPYSVFLSEPVLGCLFPEATNSKSSSF